MAVAVGGVGSGSGFVGSERDENENKKLKKNNILMKW